PSLSPHCHLALLHLPSFPTRRSSDLGSATQPFTLPRICSISSRTSARSAHLCPSASISSLRSLPPLSDSSVRVSETTSTAILSGTNGLLVSSSLLNIVGSCLLGFFHRLGFGSRIRLLGLALWALLGRVLHHGHRLDHVGHDDLGLAGGPFGGRPRRLRD